MQTSSSTSEKRFSNSADDATPYVTKSAPSQSAAKPKPRIDKHIWGIYIALVVISLIELYSASSREVTQGHIMTPLLRHGLLLGVGCLIMLGLQRIHYTVFYRLTWLIVAFSVVFAFCTMFWGEVINGARRSLSLGFFSVQSSELLKFSAALLIARVVGDNQIKEDGKPDVSSRAVAVVAGVVLAFGCMLIKQGLTNTILLMAISLSLMLIGGVSWKKFWVVVGVYAILGLGYGFVSMVFSSEGEKTEQTEKSPYEVDRGELRKQRVEYYLSRDKYNHPITPENQQAQYSFIAQANGGVLGVGPGNSRETARLPLAFSDYIYAIIIEDIGLIGGLFVIALYLFLLARAGRVGTQCRKVFPTLLIIGMAVFIVYQALFHMAIVTGVFPVSGQPLPFISKGGSSVIISSVALGIMLSVSRYAARKEEKTDTEETEMADNPINIKN